MLCGSRLRLDKPSATKPMDKPSITYAYDDSYASVFYAYALTSYVSYAFFRLA